MPPRPQRARGGIAYAAALRNQQRELESAELDARSTKDSAKLEARAAKLGAAAARAAADKVRALRAKDPAASAGDAAMQTWLELEHRANDEESKAAKAQQKADDAAAAERVYAEAAARVGSTSDAETGKVVAQNPSQGDTRIEEEAARQRSDAYKYREGRDAITRDKADADGLARLERAGDRAVAERAGDLRDQVSALSDQYRTEKAAHAASAASRGKLNERQAELESLGENLSGPERKELRKLESTEMV